MENKMTFFNVFPLSELVLVLVILEFGVMASVLNSRESFSIRKISGNLIQGVIVAMIIMSYDLTRNASIHHTITYAGLMALAWPRAIKLLLQLSNKLD